MNRKIQSLVFALFLVGWGAMGWTEFGGVWVSKYLERRSVAGRDGFLPRTLLRANGAKTNYLVVVPKAASLDDVHSDSKTRLPAILFLNGFGDNGSDGVMQLANTFGRPVWEMQETLPFFIVSPQCETSWENNPDELDKAIEILDEMIEQYPIDPDRIYLSGVSSGAAGVQAMLFRYPERFAAAVGVSGGFGGDEGFVEHLKQHRIPIWTLYNKGDGEGVVRGHQRFNLALTVAGVEHRCTPYHQPGHDSWNYAYRELAMYVWMLRHRRSENLRQPLFIAAPASDESIPSKCSIVAKEQADLDFEFESNCIGDIRIRLIDDRHSDARKVEQSPKVFVASPLGGQSASVRRTALRRKTAQLRFSEPKPAKAGTTNGQSASVRRTALRRKTAQLRFSKPKPAKAGTTNGSSLSQSERVFVVRDLERLPVSETSGNHDGLLLGRLAVHPGHLNHLALRRQGPRWTMEVNGWKLFDMVDPFVGKTVTLEVSARDQCCELTGFRYRFIDRPQSADSVRETPNLTEKSNRFLVRIAECQMRNSLSADPVLPTDQRSQRKDRLPEIAALMQERLQQATGTPIRWQRKDVFDGEPVSAVLDIEPESIQITSTRRRHGALDSNLYLKPLPQDDHDFMRAIAYKFQRVQTNAGPPMKFTRTIDRDGWTDRYELGRSELGQDADPVVLRRRSLSQDPLAWIRLAPEAFPKLQMDTLHHFAALMAFGGMGHPVMETDWDPMEIVCQSDFVHGHRCVVIEEPASDRSGYRRYWVDMQSGGLIRRFQGDAPAVDDAFGFTARMALPAMPDDTWIEIDYSPGLHPRPLGWTVCVRKSQQSPIHSIGRGQVVRHSGKSDDQSSVSITGGNP